MSQTVEIKPNDYTLVGTGPLTVGLAGREDDTVPAGPYTVLVRDGEIKPQADFAGLQIKLTQGQPLTYSKTGDLYIHGVGRRFEVVVI